MAKTPLRDLLIFLPGIMGSTLKHNGTDVWAISGAAVAGLVMSLGNNLDHLRLKQDDPTAEVLDDGVTAGEVMRGVYCVPGLAKSTGYGLLFEQLNRNFDLVWGSVDDQRPANCYAFAYDWRRDNRAAAHRLERLIARQLPIWQEHTGNPEARVILVGHSMGGLVSRYYVEVLGGWQHCRALFTLGTPHRGAISALDKLTSGFPAPLGVLNEILGTLTSGYQLLPTYPCVSVGGAERWVADLRDVKGVDPARVASALTFHEEINAAVKRNRADAAYHDRFKTIPIVGTHQPTTQSAGFVGERIAILPDLPRWIDPLLGDGDGTVPRVSAIPPELSSEYRETFVAERHGSLANHAGIMQDLIERIKQMQVRWQEPVRGSLVLAAGDQQPAIGLALDDLYPAGQPLTIQAVLRNPATTQTDLEAFLAPAEQNGPQATYRFAPEGDSWALRLPPLDPGLYHLTVQSASQAPGGPQPVRDLFEVA